MFSKKERLSRAEFAIAFPKTKRFHTQYYTVHYSPDVLIKVSVVTGKKVSKSAVVRNRVRRRLYAALRRNIHPSKKTGVYIVVCKPAITSLPARAYQGEVDATLALTK